jgi:hypothetical protein
MKPAMPAVLALALTMISVPALAETYRFTGANYIVISDLCGAGPDCPPYTTAMSLSGSFSTATPLAPNLPAGTEITAQVTAYSFSDGVNIYSSADPDARIRTFQVGTDGQGNIVTENIQLTRWLTGSTPHVAGDKFATAGIVNSGLTEALSPLPCQVVGIADSFGATSNVPDTCIQGTAGAGTTNTGSSETAGFWSTALVPALGNAALALLAAFFAGLGWHFLRRRRFSEA